LLTKVSTGISDNIRQWDLWYVAKITPGYPSWVFERTTLWEITPYPLRLEDGPLHGGFGFSEHQRKRFQLDIELGLKHRETLAYLQTQFHNRLERIKGLRDGVCGISEPLRALAVAS